jgi:hypothetical protein
MDIPSLKKALMAGTLERSSPRSVRPDRARWIHWPKFSA